MAKREYSNGYYPKIQYWSTKLNEAATAGNLEGVDNAHRKLDYFIQRQWDKEVTVRIKGNVIAGVDFTESLEALTHLGRS